MDFLPVRLSTLRANMDFSFDLYIKMPHKFLLYIREGDSLDGDRLANLKSKKVRKLFIPSNHEIKYQGFMDQILAAAMDSSSNMETVDRASIVVDTAANSVADFQKNPNSEKAYHSTTKAAKGIIGALGADPAVLKHVFEMAKEESIIVQSAINTATLVGRLAKQVGVDAAKIETMVTAALLRDVGILKLDEKIQNMISKPYDSFAPDAWNEYKNHPQLSVELMQDKPYVSPDVISLILTHEEKKSGKGFPNKISKLSLEQEIVALCSAYDREVTALGKNSAEVIKTMMIDDLGNYDLKLLQELKKVVK